MNKRSWTILAVALALVGSTSALLGYWKGNQKLGAPGLKVVSEPVFDPDGKVVATNSAYLPAQVLDYASEPLPVTPLELGWLPKDTTYGRRLYKAPDGFQVMASVVLMGTDRTSIHKPEYCLTGQGWQIERKDETSVRIEKPVPYDLPVMKFTALGVRETQGGQKARTKGVYVFWFVAENALTARHGQRMRWMARDLILTGKLQRWAYVSYFAVCPPGQEEAAFQRMKQLIAAAVPEFQLAAGEPALKSVSGSGEPRIP